MPTFWKAAGLAAFALFTAITPVVAPLSAQESTPEATDLILEAVADEQFRLQSVVPTGWEAIGNGLYVRGNDTNDAALMALQSAPLSPDELLNALLPQLALTEAPTPVGEYQTPLFDWTLYQVDVAAPTYTVRVNFAITSADGVTYTVFVQSTDMEAAALYDALFIPALDAFAPLETVAADVPYTVEEVSFENPAAEGVTLAGTLTLPEGAETNTTPYAAVVLLTGSGPQDRDERLAGIALAPFAILADELTRAGIAVLRYDDRGVGQSTGDYAAATVSDFASDAQAALDYIRTRPEIDPARVGVLGHSEGGLYAALLGPEENGPDFIISMAGTAVVGSELLLLQNQDLILAEGGTQEMVDRQIAFLNELFPLILAGDEETARTLIAENIRAGIEALPEEQRAQIGDLDRYVELQTATFASTYVSPWMAEVLTIDPALSWAQTTVPVLAIFGGKDVQVDADTNAASLEAAMAEAGNSDFTIVTLPEANHLFQQAETGAVTEYATLPAEFTPDFVPTIVDWLRARGYLAE